MRTIFIKLMIIILLTVISLPVFAAVQAESNVSQWNLTAEKTGIKCTGVYNVSGYGVVSFNSYYEQDMSGTDWPWYGLVNSDGHYVVAAKPVMEDPRINTYGDTFFISEGIICDYRRGYYNLDGTKAFDMFMYKPSEISEGFVDGPVALPFHNGYALIQYNINTYRTDGGQGWINTDGSPLYLVDKKGNIIKEYLHIDWMYYGGDGLYVITDFYTYAQYYDYQGNLKLSLTGDRYARFGTFNNGYCWVGAGMTGPYGFVNMEGTEVVPCIYDNVGLFHDGLASAEQNGKWGYIDTTGKTVIPIEYDKAYGAGDGLAMIGKDGKLGFVDYNNNIVYLEDWDDLSSFEGEVAYGVKNGELYIIKNVPVKKEISPLTIVAVTGIGGAAVGTALLLSGKLAGGTVAARAAGKAAEKAAAKAIKVKLGHRTLLINSSNEKLLKLLKSQPNLKIRTCDFIELAQQIKDVKPDLVLAEITSDSQLKEYISKYITDENNSIKHGLIINNNLNDESRKTLDQLKNQGKIVSYVDSSVSQYKIMTELVLPVLKPQVSSDASLANIGSVADALGIPGISGILDLYTTGRDLKITIEESDGDIGMDETVSIVDDIASILGIEEVKQVTDFINDVKRIKKAMKNDRGVYEAKEGLKGAKDIYDTFTDK